MARPLPYKKRVRLPPDTLDPEPRVRRRRSLSILGVLAYTALAGGAWALGTDRMPVERWLDEALALTAPEVVEPRAKVIAAFDAARAPEPATLEPAFPPPLAAESFRTDDALSSTPGPLHYDRKTPSAAEAVPPLSPAPSPAPMPSPARRVAPVAAAPRLPSPAEPSVPPAPQAVPAPAPAAPQAPAVSVSSGPSCQQAQDAYGETIVMGKARAPDLPRAALSSVLNSGSLLAGCGVPERTQVQICTAIQNGRAVGVTVTTRPGSSRVSNCVARKVRALRFPSSPHLDVTHTRF